MDVINIENLEMIIRRIGSMNKAAIELSLSVATLSRIISGKNGVGVKTIKALSAYCKANGLDPSDYINFN